MGALLFLRKPGWHCRWHAVVLFESFKMGFERAEDLAREGELAPIPVCPLFIPLNERVCLEKALESILKQWF